MASLPNGKTKKQSRAVPAFPAKVALYMRVSSEDQAERGTIEAQRDFLLGFTRLYDLPVFDEYADDGISGLIPLADRPDGRRLLEDASARCFGQVLVMRVDRLGRSLTVLLAAHTALSGVGVTLRSATEPFDTATPIGTFLFQLLGSMAELEKATILERMTRGRDRVLKKGKWTNGPIPFGYDVTAQGQLIPSPMIVDALGLPESAVVLDLFRRIADGSTAREEAKRFTALGVPTAAHYPTGRIVTRAPVWHPSRILLMVRSSTYIGEHVFESTYGDVSRQVPPLVPQALWETAQAQIEKNRHTAKSNATRSYLLRGLIVCGCCGYYYVGQVLNPTRTRTHMYYRCGARTSYKTGIRQRCIGKGVRADWLEAEVWKVCHEIILNPGKALAEAQMQLRARTQQDTAAQAGLHATKSALGRKAIERDRIMTLYRREQVPFDAVERQLQDIAAEEATLRQHLAAQEAQATLTEALAAQLIATTTMLERLQPQLAAIEATHDLTAMRQLIEMLVKRIVVETTEEDGKKHATVTITYLRAELVVAEYGDARTRRLCNTLERVLRCP
jgi:site-specific DNA recombinase